MYPKINNPEKYSAALYLRLSKEDKRKEGSKFDDSESIKNQRNMLESYCEGEKINIYDVYIDDGFSGTSYERPDFERMIADIDDGKVNMIITKDMSRFGREYIGSGQFTELYFPEKGIRYVALLDGVDTGAPDHNSDMMPFRALINDLYARDISRKITSVKRHKQKKGLFIGGKATYGYKKSETEKNVIVVDEPAAKVVRRVFQLALNGKSCREIAMLLNEENIQTPATYAGINLAKKGAYSGKWSSESISSMLKNEVYTGSMVQGRMQKVSHKSKKSRKLPREEWTVVENTHEAIVDRETFKKVARLIESRNRTRSRTYDHLLKGYIVCHECGHPLGVMNRTLAGNKETLYFVCRTYQRFTAYKRCTCHCIRVETVINAIIAEIQKICKKYIYYLNFDAFSKEARKKMQAEKRKQEKDVVDMKARLESVKCQIDRSYGDKLSRIIDEETFQRAYKRLKEEEAQLRKKVQMLEESENDNEEFDKEKIKELAEKFLRKKECSRELLVSLIEKVELTENKEILIFYRFKEFSSIDRL
jgi:Site-specific recombinases, DNA invertase Pin homologs